MAEGGGDEGDENPFSYKNFVHTKDKNILTPQNDDEFVRSSQGNDILDGTNALFPDNDFTSPVCQPAEQDGKSKPKKKSSDGNPFSFKKFLAHSGSKNRRHNGPAHDLPDFVQDHYFGDTSRDRNVLDLDLPNCILSSNYVSGASDLNNSKNDLSNHEAQERRRTLLGENQIRNELTNTSPNIENDLSFKTESEDSQPQLASSLPDFLSDGAFVNNNDNTRYPAITVQVNQGRQMAALQINGDTELELRRLREENCELRKELCKAQQQAAKEANRVNKVLKEMEEKQKCEKQETEDLEKIIQQVEANLETTTLRATKAESMVSKLKQDMKLLQKQIQTLQKENEILQSGDLGTAYLKQKTFSASEQLATVAASAEQSLRQLLSGVDSLRMLSAVLASADKVQEESCDNQKGNS
ncbi:endosome-associated-trafficking regulator 1 [Octopus bimaculoides]|uniref:Endosome-associated-trafficking regulator 1 n=1 Tax=Octopus bimaculoides TaxID=37653 RepID=A0A0L8HPY3_OCTBM|nr:endosome-associated-trafficking regulator 1 [Octopus bimaculoides]|eukprot:XP_014770487.1 PREDICTED: serologically defined colon cancer antigen 3 homolog [Octopus bimaculoides]